MVAAIQQRLIKQREITSRHHRSWPHYPVIFDHLTTCFHVSFGSLYWTVSVMGHSVCKFICLLT